MTLSKETLEKIAQIDELQEQLRAATAELSSLISKDTNDMFMMCYCDIPTQLYHLSGSVDEAKDAIVEFADDGEMYLKWRDKEYNSWSFNVDRHRFCILFDNEK